MSGFKYTLAKSTELLASRAMARRSWSKPLPGCAAPRAAVFTWVDPIDINLILDTYFSKPFSDGWWTNPAAIRTNAEKLVNEFDVRASSINAPVRNLSGGNQQKVIIARELSRPIKLLVINQPTRGLDVGSIEFIHRRIIAARDTGVAVLLISADLDEILSLSDRIGVMYNGQIVEELLAEQASRERIGLYMAGLMQEGGHETRSDTVE